MIIYIELNKYLLMELKNKLINQSKAIKLIIYKINNKLEKKEYNNFLLYIKIGKEKSRGIKLLIKKMIL